MKKNQSISVFFISIISLVIIGITLIAYNLDKLINLKYFTNSEQYIFHTDKLGHFGDFIGGFLGTILTGIATYFVYKTYISQKEELEKQKEELILNRQLITQQQFESTFFNMLNVHRELKNNLSILKEDKKDKKNEEIITGSSVFNHLMSKYSFLENNFYKEINGLIKYVDKSGQHNWTQEEENEVEKSQKEFYGKYDSFYKEYRFLFDHYSINIYHILKFINENEKKDKDKNKIEKYKKYATIFSSQLDSNEIQILKLTLIHINEENSNNDIIELIKHYDFLSHSNYDPEIINTRKFYYFDVN